MQRLTIDGNSLGLQDVIAVARTDCTVALAESAREKVYKSEAWVRQAATGTLVDAQQEPLSVYGVNTGFGSLARIRIPSDQISKLSLNLIRSHAAGVGRPLPHEVVRAMMLLRANALAKGASGCRIEIIELICAMLSEGVIPEVPSQGSCGSSGDLAPLSHLGLVIFRDTEEDLEKDSGIAWFQGKRLSGLAAMTAAGLKRLVPMAKEGLAINNGAQASTALLALAAYDADRLVRVAEVAAAMSWEALRGVSRALHPAIHALRPYRGAINCAAALRRLIEGSTLVDSIPGKVQDAYSLRCTPQVIGAVRDGVGFALQQVNVEINSATDNPLILVDEEGENKAFSGGLFHGEPVGMAADHLKLAISELANLAERRLFRLTNGDLSVRLPPLLVEPGTTGLGAMIPQSVAAALVSENKNLCWPASADSIPTCEDQEDHVAMSTTATRRAREVVANSTRVIAIEILCAAKALAWRKKYESGSQLGKGASAVLAWLSELPSGTDGERIEWVAEKIRNGELLTAVEAEVGIWAGCFDV